MEIIGNIFAALMMLTIALIPVMWIWVGYHVIKCHKADNCANRKCTYWKFCNHNAHERKKDEFLWRIEMMEASTGDDLSEVKEMVKNK